MLGWGTHSRPCPKGPWGLWVRLPYLCSWGTFQVLLEVLITWECSCTIAGTYTAPWGNIHTHARTHTQTIGPVASPAPSASQGKANKTWNCLPGPHCVTPTAQEHRGTLKNYSLFVWNSNPTGCPVFLFAKSSNPRGGAFFTLSCPNSSGMKPPVHPQGEKLS